MPFLNLQILTKGASRSWIRRGLVLFGLLGLVGLSVESAPAYPGAREISDRMTAAAGNSQGLVSIETLPRTGEGPPVRLARIGTGDARQPAVLLVAGLDGRHLIGTEVALRHLERLAEEAEASRDSLDGSTLWILPSLLPDAGRSRSPARLRATAPGVGDQDKDGLVDEDPADDLDGDGVIRCFRLRDGAGSYRSGLDRPELLVPVDRARGETGEWRLFLEGRDDDGDRQWNEEEDGGVLLSANFPFGYQWFARNRGLHQVSEPTTRALADFLVAHPEIGVVLVYGFENNLLQAWPDGKTSSPNLQASRYGRSPVTEPNENDLPLYREFSRRYHEMLGFEKPKNGLGYGGFLTEVHPEGGMTLPTATEAAQGGFGSWVYFHRGRTALLTPCWTPRLQLAWNRAASGDGSEDDSEENGDTGEGEDSERKSDDADTDESNEAGNVDKSETVSAEYESDDAESSAPMSKAEAQAKPAPEAESKPPEAVRDLAEFHDWLVGENPAAWSDWSALNHPDFPGRPGEVGGYAPGAWINPPPPVIDRVAELHHEFLFQVLAAVPRVRIRALSLQSRGAEVYELELEVANESYLPDVLGQGVYSTHVRPTRFELDLPGGGTVLGDAGRDFVERIPGSGEVRTVRRLLRLPQPGPVRVNIISELGGRDDRRIAVGERWRKP